MNNETIQTEPAKDVDGSSTTTKFRVLLSKYPDEFYVDAENESDAVEMAKQKVRYSVWESIVEVAE